MTYDQRKQPRLPSGSSNPPEDMKEAPRKFELKEKIYEMARYALPILSAFPRRDRLLASKLRSTIYDMVELVVRIEVKHSKRTSLEDLDVKLQVLKEFIKLASDREYSGVKSQPPLTKRQRETWAKINKQIGSLIGGYLRSVKQQ